MDIILGPPIFGNPHVPSCPDRSAQGRGLGSLRHKNSGLLRAQRGGLGNLTAEANSIRRAQMDAQRCNAIVKLGETYDL